MANPANGTVTTLVANGFKADPTGDVFDTGSNGSPASLDYDVSGDSRRVIFQVTNQMATAITIVVGVGAGDYPPAMNASLGAYASANLAQNAIGWYGPFSSGQVMQSAQHTGGSKAGKITLTLTPASGTLAATVKCFKVPNA
jgi:hypothetical protein